MNISFQPVESLGRRLYSFTATAVQVDDTSIANYNKYGIQTTGDYSTYIIYNHDVLGQIYGTYQYSDGNLLNTKISQKYKNLSSEDFINQVNNLKWLRLEIESDPYVIIENNGQLVKATTSSQINAPNATVGHIVTINGSEMIIYPRMMRRSKNCENDTSTQIVYLSIFELKESNTSITDLRFKYPTTVTIDYVANLDEIEAKKLAKAIYYYQNPGQLYGSFEPKDSLVRKIYNKYRIDYKKYYQYLIDITEIQVQGPPGAVVYIKDSKDSELNRHILENGYLQLRDEDAMIEGLYFCGIHLTECKNPLETKIVNGLGIDDFVLQSGIYNSINDIENPINGGIYQIRTNESKNNTILENYRIFATDENNVGYQEVTPEMYQTLILNSAGDNNTLKFVYYYNCWYLLEEGYEKTKLLKGDLRQLRDDEFILVNDYYDSFQDIGEPIPNGVYWVASYTVSVDDADDYDSISNLLTVSENDNVIERADKKYTLIINKLYEENKNRYIYYHGKWYLFTSEHDILCPVDGLVDYYYTSVKGVY